jgi:DNA-binding response OmpR family regulator
MKKILFIEDNDDIARSLAKRLEMANYSVRRLKDGWEALAHLMKKEELPDALVLDLMLPGRTGHELLSTIKSVLPDTKIFIFSAHDQSFGAIPKSCVEGFFLKTAGIENLLTAINNSLGMSKKKDAK